MNEYEANGFAVPENKDNNQNNGASVDYSAAPGRAEGRPNGEYHYSYRRGYSSSYSTASRPTYSPYSQSYERDYGSYSYTAPHTEEAQKPKKERKTFGAGVVCALLAACIILSEGVTPEDGVLARAAQQGINLLSSQKPTFEVCADLSSVL